MSAASGGAFTFEDTGFMAEGSNRVMVSTMPAGSGRSALTALTVVGALIGAPTFAVAQTAAPSLDLPATKPAAAKPAATPAKPAAPATQAAPAKPAAPAAAAPAAPGQAAQADDDDRLPWVKICSKDADKRNLCLVAKELRGQDERLVASVALRDIEGDPKKTLLIAVPAMVLIQPGMRVAVDKGKQEEAKYTICFPNACYAEMPVSDQMFADLKKGQALTITSLSVQQKPMSYPFRLSNFKAALEGPGIDPSAQQQNQEQLQEQLQKKAEEAAKKLEGTTPKP